MDEKLKKDYIATIGVDVTNIKIKVESNEKKELVTLTVWDLAGQNQFQNVRKTFYLGANVGILIFDVTNKQSFYNLDDWIHEVQESQTSQLPFFLVGNKIDLPNRLVSKEQMEEYSKKRKEIIAIQETSALTGSGIRNLFHSCAEIIYNSDKVLSLTVKKGSKKQMKKTSKKSSKKSKAATVSKETTVKKSTKNKAKSSSKKTAKRSSKKKKASKKSKKK